MLPHSYESIPQKLNLLDSIQVRAIQLINGRIPSVKISSQGTGHRRCVGEPCLFYRYSYRLCLVELTSNIPPLITLLVPAKSSNNWYRFSFSVFFLARHLFRLINIYIVYITKGKHAFSINWILQTRDYTTINNTLYVIQTLLPPVSERLLNTIFFVIARRVVIVVKSEWRLKHIRW